MYDFTLNKGDRIGNPLVYGVLEDDWEMEPRYSVSQAGLWSVKRGEDISIDNSLRLFTGKRKWSIKDIYRHTKTHIGYSVPITIQEILDQEYAIPSDLEGCHFDDDVLEQVKASSFGASQIYQMTGKIDGNSFVVARNESHGGAKPEKDTSSEEEPDIWGLPA